MISLATVTLPHVSGFSEDDVMNTWVIESPSSWAPSLDLGEVTIPLAGFYNWLSPGNHGVGQKISASISRASLACRIRLYDITDHLDGSNYGSPYAEDGFTLTANPSQSALPEEVALCMTLRANAWEAAAVEAPDGPDSGTAVDRPRQRLSGRVYLGPWTFDALGALTAGRQRPHTALQQVILDSGERLVDQLLVGNHTLNVWSRKNASVTPVTHLQVDDAWDTQRRRGADPLTRTTRTVVP